MSGEHALTVVVGGEMAIVPGRTTTREGRTTMNKTIPARRLQLAEEAPRQYAAMYRLERSIELERPFSDLVALRASQINGCAFCIDMHWKDARAAGESEERLYSLAAWRESPLYGERERAALALCEAMTLISDSDVPDDVWQPAEAAFTPEGLAQLVFAITAINAWNRLMITARVEPGHYEPGLFEAA
jgi:AhpD family alkylhydroperoxidase